MLVLINTETSCVDIYSPDGLESVAFDEVENIADTIGNSPVIYITGAVESSAQEIINLVKEMLGQGSLVVGNSNLDDVDNSI